MVYHLGPFEGKAMYAWNGWCDVWWLTQMKASRKIRIFWHTHSHIIFIHLCRRNCIIPSLELLDNLNMYYVDEFMLVTYFYIMRNIFLHIPSTITDLVFIFGCCFSSVIFSLQGCYAGVSNFSFTWHDSHSVWVNGRCCGGVGSENERERGEMGGVSMKISKRWYKRITKLHQVMC